MANALRPRVGVMAVASALEVGADRAPGLLDACTEALREGTDAFAVGVVDTPHSALDAGRALRREGVEAIVAVAASWFEDYLVGDALEEWPAPLVLWAVPGMETGSLCGCQQASYLLQQLGWPCVMVFGEVGASAPTGQALRFARVAGLLRRLRQARIGLIGHRVEGMTETTADELALKRLLGPRVVGIDTQIFLERVGRSDVAQARAAWERVSRSVGRVLCQEGEGLESMRVYGELRQLAHEEGLAAVAVGCYPHLMGKVCLAASLLGEEGVPVACEGDVNGAVGMLVLTWLSGEPVHNTDFLDPLPDGNAIVFSHCGSGGFSLACARERIELAPVRLMDRGVCCRFPARTGPVTLINLVPAGGGYRMGVLYGEAVPVDMVFPGNPLAVRFKQPWEAVVEWVATEGLGHHWMAAYGDYRAELRLLARLTGCRDSQLE